MSLTQALHSRLGTHEPKLALVLGSGLGDLAGAVEEAQHIPYEVLPGFPQAGVSGHAGELVVGRLGETEVIVMAGRAHYYEHGDAAVMRPALEALAGVGITDLILTNAAGSLRQDMPPGSVMLVTDHINFSGANPLIGETDERRFVGMSEAYDAGLRRQLAEAAKRMKVALHSGVYMWFSGPSFETPAEIRMARTMGADAVGMSTVPEVILARFLGLRVAACSVITNFGAGMGEGELSHRETKEMAPLGGRRLGAILTAMLSEGGSD